MAKPLAQNEIESGVALPEGPKYSPRGFSFKLQGNFPLHKPHFLVCRFKKQWALGRPLKDLLRFSSVCMYPVVGKPPTT